MNLKKFLHDDDAVSPVIGVILMVAITVILAAVIASFVLGLGDTAGSAAPQASWSYSYNDDASGNDDFTGTGADDSGNGILTISHDGGDTISADRLKVTGSASVEDRSLAGTNNPYGTDSELNAGSSFTMWVEEDDTIRIVWEDPDGGSSSILSTYEV